MINQLEMIINSVPSSQTPIPVSWPIYWRIGYGDFSKLDKWNLLTD